MWALLLLDRAVMCEPKMTFRVLCIIDRRAHTSERGSTATMTCTATCSGYTSLRSECIANPCYADNLCQFIDPTIPDCAAWCCEGRGGYVFFAVILFCLGAFLLLAAYYVHRLHQENVKAGAVTKDGKQVTTAPVPAPQHAKRLRAVFSSSGAALAPA